MFTKILIANRGDNAVAAKTDCLVREAHAGEITPMEPAHV